MKYKPKKWVIPAIIAALLVLAAAGYFAYYVHSLAHIEIVEGGISEFPELSLQGFTLKGYLDLYNPSLISVHMREVNYVIVFEPTEQVLAEGLLQGEKLKPKQITRIPIQQSVNWVPALSLSLSLAASDAPANVVVTGNVFITENIKLPFVYKVDIREFFKQHAQQYLESKKQGAVEKIEEKYGKTAGMIAEHIAGYLPRITEAI